MGPFLSDLPATRSFAVQCPAGRHAGLVHPSRLQRGDALDEECLGDDSEVVEGRDAVARHAVVGLSASSVGMPRMVLVTGATSTLFNTGIAASRVMTKSGRRPASGTSAHQISPRLTTVPRR